MPRGGARLLQGGPIAAEIRQAVGEDVAAYRDRHGQAPVLAVVICGRDAPSMVYLHQILRSCEKVGIDGRLVEIDGEASEAALVDAIRALNDDPAVNGIIVQMPLPPTIRLRSVVDAIDPAKDIDGIHPLNAGLLRLGYDGFLPATAHAAVEILRRSAIEIEGKRAVVIGRSAVVGMPAAFLLVRENATVTVCHSRTRDLARHVKDAEILVVAAGHPGLVRGDMLRRGVVVVDVGINVVDGAIVGDVEFESARRVASAITPVPGGIGPLTNALLLAHLVRAALGQEARVEVAADAPLVATRGPAASRKAAAATVPDRRVAAASRSAGRSASRGVR
ncbi:MAG: bifunctional 5,10-methylenetetrahydrofolate dehydrogenase/5,10-methenyltetrahydrofolate cyclohydrolase [Chloroflexi bacterium]|nr:MAG: bifunctional 5,10-methylenetetrahydrofolate dehydrogenase/5,10-methenyltetrahydrofolate cyclohydrolase [Chloroflexota bacterium]